MSIFTQKELQKILEDVTSVESGSYDLNDKVMAYEYLMMMIGSDCDAKSIRKIDTFSNRMSSEKLALVCDLLVEIALVNNAPKALSQSILNMTKIVKYHSNVLKKSSVIDELTGLFSYNYLKVIESKLKRERFLLVFFDLDDFKKVNDTFGHEYGNDVIVEFSHALKKSFRLNDLIFRYGGDEFLVVITRPALSVHKIEDKIRHNLHNQDISFSLGWAYNDNKSLSDTIRLADENMYLDKGKKRNERIESDNI